MKGYKIECNLTIGDSFIQILGTSTGVTIKSIGSLDSDEHAAVDIISQTLNVLKNGGSVDRHFNPTNPEDGIIVKCQWTKHGALKIVKDPAEKKFMHAKTVHEAMKRRRNFTCERRTFNSTPKVRQDRPGDTHRNYTS